MKLIPNSPVIFVLIIVAFFAMGMLVGKMFGKKVGKAEKFDTSGEFGTPFGKAEKFDTSGEFGTPSGMANGPKVLPPVPENIGVVSSETWCKKFNC